MNNKKKAIIIICLIITCMIFIFSIFFSLININNNNILEGISISGIDISGKSKEEAMKTVSEKITQKTENNIKIFASEDYEKTITFDYLETKYNIKESIDEAYNTGRNGNIFKNNFDILNLMINKKDIELKVELNEEKLNNLINEICASLPNKVIQSNYYIEEENLIITRGSEGNIIESDKLKEDLYLELNDINKTDNYINAQLKNIKPDEINIENIYKEIHKEVQNANYEKNPFKVISESKGVTFDKENAQKQLETEQEEYTIKLIYTYPEITIKDLDIDIFRDQLGYYTTKYNLSNKDRTANLELAAEKINGTILSPGEEFSYNKVVGARTIEKGYKEAKIYSDGKVVDGIGGGICQISSTLYNSAIFANLDITERYNHMFITSYVPVGRDATVVYGAKDFKFVNNRSYPIKIQMKVINSIVSCEILRNKRGARVQYRF